MFRDIANGCKSVQIINTSLYNELFDGMNHKSLSERVELFIRKITFLFELCPDQISKFLSILNEQEDTALCTIADRIAASCTCKLSTNHQNIIISYSIQ